MRRIPLARISGRAPNNDTDRNKVARYRRALRRGEVFPPIKITREPFAYGRSGHGILDGVHRFHAHRLEGRKTIRADIWTRADIAAHFEEIRRALAAFNPIKRRAVS
jgi:hypothetical protein